MITSCWFLLGIAMAKGLFAILSLMFCLAASSLSTAKEVTTADGSCALHVSAEEVLSFTWDGACVDGFVAGDGNLTVFGDDGIVATYKVGSKHGYVLTEGGAEQAITIDPTTFRRTAVKCYDSPMGGYVSVLVPQEVDTANALVRLRIFDAMSKVIREACVPDPDRFTAYRVTARVEGVSYPRNSFEFEMSQDLHGQKYRNIGGRWKQEIDRIAAYNEEFVAAREAAELAERKRIKEERRRKLEEEARIAALKRAQTKAKEHEDRLRRIATTKVLYEDMARNFKIDELVLDGALTVNPYAFDGKRVAVTGYFIEMLSRDEALFLVNDEPAVLKGVTFKEAGYPKVLVLANFDKGERLLPKFGTRFVLTADWKATYNCALARCDDALEWARQ